MDLETGYNRNTSVVIRQSLFRLDSRAPGQVDHLNLKMCKKKEVDNPKEKCIFLFVNTLCIAMYRTGNVQLRVVKGDLT